MNTSLKRIVFFSWKRFLWLFFFFSFFFFIDFKLQHKTQKYIRIALYYKGEREIPYTLYYLQMFQVLHNIDRMLGSPLTCCPFNTFHVMLASKECVIYVNCQFYILKYYHWGCPLGSCALSFHCLANGYTCPVMADHVGHQHNGTCDHKLLPLGMH